MQGMFVKKIDEFYDSLIIRFACRRVLARVILLTLVEAGACQAPHHHNITTTNNNV